jgi:hypothetical protein
MRILKLVYIIIGFIAITILFTGIGIAAYGSIYNIPDTDPIVGIFKLIMVIGICIGLLWGFLIMLYLIIDEYIINP